MDETDEAKCPAVQISIAEMCSDMNRSGLHLLIHAWLLITLPGSGVVHATALAADNGYSYADCRNKEYNTVHSFICCDADLDGRGAMRFIREKGANCRAGGAHWQITEILGGETCLFTDEAGIIHVEIDYEHSGEGINEIARLCLEGEVETSVVD